MTVEGVAILIIVCPLTLALIFWCAKTLVDLILNEDKEGEKQKQSSIQFLGIGGENESCEEEGQDEETNCMFDQPIRFGEVWASDFDKNAFILLGVFPGRDWTDEQIKRAKDFLANTDNPFLYPLLTKELAYREEQKEQLHKLMEYASEFDCADTPSEEAKK